MSPTIARAAKWSALAMTVALFVNSASPAQAQPGFPNRFTPQMPMLNNGSLYTFPNPTNGQPNQLPYAYIAVAHQDCRLYHNGATLMPVNRLLAGLCTDMQPATVPLSGGYIPTYQSIFAQAGGGGGNNGGNNNGNVFGNNNGQAGGVVILPPQFPFNPQQMQQQQMQALRYQAYQQQQAYQYQAMRNAAMQSNAYDNYRNYAGGAALLPGGGTQSTFFNPVPNTAGGMTTVGANPFAAFNVDREKEKDKEKEKARKEEDALREERKND